MTEEPFDFDRVENWGPALGSALSDLIPSDIGAIVAHADPQFIEDARDKVLASGDARRIAERLWSWLKARPVYAYHGSRLLPQEVAAIRAEGLQPLIATARIERLRLMLGSHPKWKEAEPRLQAAVERFGAGNCMGHREGQVHLTVSRSGLVKGFNYYLRQGSEFDWHVTGDLLGAGGQSLLQAQGEATLFRIRVPGAAALSACNPFIELSRDLPNLVSETLAVWAFRLAHPTYSSASLQLDCGMIFKEAVPATWIDAVMAIKDEDLPQR